jgi:hypothetical protein
MKQSLEEELLGIKQDIEQARTERDEIEGQRKGLYRQLESDWECKTIGQAEKKLVVMQKELATLETKLEEGLADYHGKYQIRG